MINCCRTSLILKIMGSLREENFILRLEASQKMGLKLLGNITMEGNLSTLSLDTRGPSL